MNTTQLHADVTYDDEEINLIQITSPRLEALIADQESRGQLDL